MALYSGVDPVAIASGGVYTETYTSATEQANINALAASYGLLEEVPSAVGVSHQVRWHWLFEMFKRWNRG